VLDFLGDNIGGGMGVSASGFVTMFASPLLVMEAGCPVELVGDDAGAEVFTGFVVAAAAGSCPGIGTGTGVVILGVTTVPPGVRTGGGIGVSARDCEARPALR